MGKQTAQFKILKRYVDVPGDGLTGQFVTKSGGLTLHVRYTSLMIGEIRVINIRLVVNDTITASVDFSLGFLQSVGRDRRANQILLGLIFSTKIVQQILDGIKG